MGILSSLFQTGAPAPQVAGPMLGTSKLPEELAPYYKDILGKAQALYNERTGEGFQPYQGPTIADFTPEQQQAFTGISGLVGQQAPVFEEAMDLTRSAAAPMTSEQMTQYMSPYQQAVTDIEKREATKQYESQVQPALAAKAATTGGFGGSRQAILEGMAADTQQRLLSDIQAKGSQQAYQDAVKRFQTDRTAAGQAGAQLATMAPNQFKAQLGELGAVQTIGEEKQRQQQTALDEAFRQYQLERNFPYDTMSQYQAVVTGAPVRPTTFAPPPAPTPSIGQQLIGGIGTLGAAYGAFTGNNPLDLIRRKGGGGLSDLPIVYRQTSGSVSFPEAIDPYQRRQGESVQEFGARVQSLKTGDPSIYQNWLRNNKRTGTTDMSGRSGIETAVALAEAAKAEGQGKEVESNIFQDNMVIPERELDSDVQKTIDERNELMNKNKTNTNIIEPIEVTRNTNTGDGGITAIDALQSATGNTFFEGTPRPDYPTIDASGLEGLRASTNQLNTDINSFIKANEGRMSSEQLKQEINKNFGADLKALEEFQANEQNILAQQMAEDAEERGKYFDTESATAKDAMQRQQYGNLAQFFARLGTASPKQEGLAGVLGAGLEAADATLPQAMQTQQAYQARLAGLRGDRRAEEKSDKVISRTEQKSIRKDLYTGKKDLTKSKREDLIAANDRDIDIASKTIAARGQGLASETDLVNAEISLGAAQNENAILALQFAEDTDFSDIFPDPNEGNNIMIPILGGDAYKNRPDLNKKIGSAWNRAYAEVVAEIKKQDKILRKDDLTKQEVTFAIQNLAKSYLDANLPQKPPPGNNVETEDSATPDDILTLG